MLFKRVGLYLSGVSICGMGLIGASPAVAATGQAATARAEVISTAGHGTAGFRALSNCPITSFWGNAGAYICETTAIRITWTDDLGSIVGVDDVVIGTDHRIYNDPGSGWHWLGNGVASSTASQSTIGLFVASNDTIRVIGTDNQSYCNTTFSFPAAGRVGAAASTAATNGGRGPRPRPPLHPHEPREPDGGAHNITVIMMRGLEVRTGLSDYR